MIVVWRWSIYFACAGASVGQIPAVGSEVLTRVLVVGDEVLTREWLSDDSGSDSLSARVVAGLADFLSSDVQCPTAGYSLVHEHLTTGITYLDKVNPSRGSNYLEKRRGNTQADVSERLLARHVAPDHCVLLFPEGSLSVLCGSRPSVKQRITGPFVP